MLIRALAVLLAAPAFLGSAPVGEDSADEYAVKAAMYVNMLRLVDWPAAKRGDPGSPMVIGVTGSDEMARALETIIRSKSVSNRKITIRRIAGTTGLGECHSVFLGGGDRRKIQAAIEALGQNPVLTVGEDDRFIPLGGMIALDLRDGTVQVEVNLDVARKDGLSISSQLLKIAILRMEKK